MLLEKVSGGHCTGLIFLLGLLTGCAQGPFTRPAKVVLFEERNRADTAAPASKPETVPSHYVVRSGDTVYSVAEKFGVPIRGVLQMNGLKAPYVLLSGQKLRLPVPRRHAVREGDTVYGIARKYGVAISSLVRVNDISPPYTIITGTSLRIPERVQTVSVPANNPVRRPAERNRPSASKPNGRAPTKPGETVALQPAPPPPAAIAKPVPRAAIPKPPPRGQRNFLLPVRGRIISQYGPQGRGLHNDGINIAASEGTPVRAAENGIVVYSGNALLGFGNMLLVRHADGYMTAYAHNSRLMVKRGDVVRRGQVIAEVGSTGNVSTPQLHFEVRKGKKAVNPVKYLPNLASRL